LQNATQQNAHTYEVLCVTTRYDQDRGLPFNGATIPTIDEALMTRFLALCCMIALAACDSPTDRGAAVVPWLQGSWDYAATQDTPQLRMTGTLAISQQIGDSISGSIEYIEVDAGGHGRPRLNLFTGRIRNGRDITITAYAGNRTRTHTGMLLGDSIGGSFAQPITDSTSYRGNFLARRQ
jgi:hypothetical protein